MVFSKRNMKYKQQEEIMQIEYKRKAVKYINSCDTITIKDIAPRGQVYKKI